MRKDKGHTVLELMIAFAVFSMFLLGIFAVINFGLKNYRLIDMKSEIRGSAQVAMGRILGELKSTDITSLVMGPAEEEYMVFETAVDPVTHKLEIVDRVPQWQGYVLYYTFPRDPNATDKMLFRKYVPHTPRTLAKKMTSIALYLNDTTNTGEELTTVTRNIYDMDISISTDGFVVNLDLTTNTDFADRRLAYQKDFSDDVAKGRFKVSASVMPRNTKD